MGQQAFRKRHTQSQRVECESKDTVSTGGPLPRLPSRPTGIIRSSRPFSSVRLGGFCDTSKVDRRFFSCIFAMLFSEPGLEVASHGLPLAGGILASFDNWPSPMKSVQKNVQTLTLSVEIVLLAPGGSLAGFWNNACQSATPLSLLIF